jgi:hypothetical protein
MNDMMKKRNKRQQLKIKSVYQVKQDKSKASLLVMKALPKLGMNTVKPTVN